MQIKYQRLKIKLTTTAARSDQTGQVDKLRPLKPINN